MNLPPPSDHFQGKSVVEHLREARTRGATLAAEVHGAEMPGSLSALCDASKEVALALLLLWILFHSLGIAGKFWAAALLFSCGWTVWKTGRSALLGWTRMERLHRLIEEERWEIEHHREQEREELTEMYRAKGFEGELLEAVIDTLMADDNRLLRVMLEEELGLTLEAIEHPIRQALGAFIGALGAALLCLFGFWVASSCGLIVTTVLILFFSTLLSIRLERNPVLHLLTWNLAVAGLSIAVLYFLIPLTVSR